MPSTDDLSVPISVSIVLRRRDEKVLTRNNWLEVHETIRQRSVVEDLSCRDEVGSEEPNRRSQRRLFEPQDFYTQITMKARVKRQRMAVFVLVTVPAASR
jgi:hypothetical protein